MAKRITALDAELADNRQTLDSTVNAQIRTQITDRTIGTAFRDEWQGDYRRGWSFSNRCWSPARVPTTLTTLTLGSTRP